MAKKFLVNIDLVQNQILNPLFQVIASDPSTPSEGQFWYNSTSDRFKYRGNGTSWTPWVDGADIPAGNIAISKLATDPLARANHTGTQLAATISDLATAVGAVAVGGDVTGTVSNIQYGAGSIVNADINASAAIALSKLAVDPLARANHTGTQLLATISDITATATEVNYIDGVTSSIQTQLDTKARIYSGAAYTTATAIGTAAKTVTGVEPAAGTMVAITYTNGNSAASATIAFNGGSARAVHLGGTAATALDHTVAAGTEVLYYFDGTILNLLGAQDNTDTDTTYPIISAGDIVNGAHTTASTITGQRAVLLLARSAHTGTQLAATISDFATAAGGVSVGGDLTGTVGNAQIAAGAIMNADINASAAIALSKLATDPLARANHTGTQTAATISDFNTAVRTNRLDQMAAPTAAVSMNSQKITNLATPTVDTDAATKLYVDQAVAGLAWKDAVRAATTANITLSGAQTIDTVSVVAGDRVLVKNQSTGAQNGVYVAAAGAWTRATDADSDTDLSGMAVMVEEGGQNGTQWILTTDTPITVGTTALSYAQFGGGSAYTAGTGITLTGSVFSADIGTGLTFSGNDIVVDTSLIPRKFAASVGNGALTSIAVNHAFGTRDVAVDVYDNATYDTVECDIVRTDTNNVTVSFAVAPTSNQYRVVVVG